MARLNGKQLSDDLFERAEKEGAVTSSAAVAGVSLAEFHGV